MKKPKNEIQERSTPVENIGVESKLCPELTDIFEDWPIVRIYGWPLNDEIHASMTWLNR